MSIGEMSAMPYTTNEVVIVTAKVQKTASYCASICAERVVSARREMQLVT